MPINPTRIMAPAIDVDAPVQAKPSSLQYDPQLGRNADLFGVPEGDYAGVSAAQYVTWWSAYTDGTKTPLPGSVPTDLNRILFFGHTSIGGMAVFDNLGKFHTGQTASVEGTNTAGKQVILHIRVIRVLSGIPKDDETALIAAINSAPKGTRMSWVTCSGTINTNLESHDDNLEVDFTITAADAAGN